MSENSSESTSDPKQRTPHDSSNQVEKKEVGDMKSRPQHVDQQKPEAPTYKLREKIGSGGSGIVYRVTATIDHAKGIKEDAAIKAVRARGLSRRAQMYLARELFVHRTLKGHPHICNFYHNFTDRENIYIVMELLRGGDLFTVLRSSERGFNERYSLTVIAQVLDALRFMHGLGIAHRDVKLENIMFAEKPDPEHLDKICVKLIDFGLACVRNVNASPKERMSSEKCGTIRYSAPEVVSEKEYVPEEVDIWSTGVVLYSIIARRNPYSGTTDRSVLQEIEGGRLLFNYPPWDAISRDTIQLIQKMLSRQGKDRPTASEAHDEVLGILAKLDSNELSPLPIKLETSDSHEHNFLSREGEEKGPSSSVSKMEELKGKEDSVDEGEQQSDSLFDRLRAMILNVANLGGVLDSASSSSTENSATESTSIQGKSASASESHSQPEM